MQDPKGAEEQAAVVPVDILDALAAAVAGVMPTLIARIPPEPAAQLGRLGVPVAPGEHRIVPGRGRLPFVVPVPERAPGSMPGAVPPSNLQPGPAPVTRPQPGPRSSFVSGLPARHAEAGALSALRGLGQLLPERVLGALELAVDEVDLRGVPNGLTASLPIPERKQGFVTALVGGGGTEEVVSLLDQLRPGASALAHTLVQALATHPAITPHLAAETPVPPHSEVDGVNAESAVAARHGAAYLALAVATAMALLRELAVRMPPPRAATVVGLGLGAAAQILAVARRPSAYEQAALARRRAEYILPRQAYGNVVVAGSCFALTEAAFPAAAAADPAGFTDNGLVTPIPGGALIRTGLEAGPVRVDLATLAGPPDTVDVRGWDEVVEVSWTAATGSAAVLGPAQALPGVTALSWPGGVADTTPPWPGDYRLRVHVAGRDEREAYDHRGGGESYRLIVWAAPPGPQVVHKRSDQLGYSLRGESAPPRRPRPELAYRWVRQSPVFEAATITVVTGMDVPEALQAFGADPNTPVSMTEIREDYDAYPSWVAVLAVDGAVVAVEDNGFRGSHQDVLEAVSLRGRAASMYWNVNALSRLSLAEGGRLLASFEPGLEDPQLNAPAALPYLKDLDLDDYRDKIAKCLVAVERFTGYAVRAEDLDRIESTGAAYLIPSR